MIIAKRHRELPLEAPRLHSDNEDTVWKAHLFNHDDPSVITEDIEGTKDSDTGIIVFTFPIDQIDMFDDGDKLDVEIWPTDNLSDMYWEEKAIRVEESQIPVEE